MLLYGSTFSAKCFIISKLFHNIIIQLRFQNAMWKIPGYMERCIPCLKCYNLENDHTEVITMMYWFWPGFPNKLPNVCISSPLCGRHFLSFFSSSYSCSYPSLSSTCCLQMPRISVRSTVTRGVSVQTGSIKLWLTESCFALNALNYLLQLDLQQLFWSALWQTAGSRKLLHTLIPHRW